MRPRDISSLESAIKIRYECRPTHKETVFVREKTVDNQTIWQGNVEVFDLEDHDHAKTCYAWQHTEERGRVKIFAVLGNEIIYSPSRAVQAAIFVDAQPPEIQPAESELDCRDDEFQPMSEIRGFEIYRSIEAKKNAA